MVNITQINSNTLQLNSTQSPLLQNLKVGQTLSAQVIKPMGTQVLLQIGNHSVLADTTLKNLNSGHIQVTVKQTQPSVVLSLKTSEQLPNQALNNNNAILQQGYRNLMGQQLPVGQALQQMAQLPNLPSLLQVGLNNLLEQLLRPRMGLDGKHLSSSIQNSGLFFESQLKQKRAPNNKDVKAQLLNLQKLAGEQLKLSPQSEGLNKLNSLLTQALNKLTVQQLQLFEHPDKLHLELPVMLHEKPVNARFEFYKRDDLSDDIWEVILKIDIDNRPVEFKLQLDESQQQLTCYIWCESDSQRQELEPQLDYLQSQFQQLGLNTQRPTLSQQPFQAAEFSTKVALIDITV